MRTCTGYAIFFGLNHAVCVYKHALTSDAGSLYMCTVARSSWSVHLRYNSRGCLFIDTIAAEIDKTKGGRAAAVDLALPVLVYGRWIEGSTRDSHRMHNRPRVQRAIPVAQCRLRVRVQCVATRVSHIIIMCRFCIHSDVYYAVDTSHRRGACIRVVVFI